jgi:hypothetical protein
MQHACCEFHRWSFLVAAEFNNILGGHQKNDSAEL